jgi:hypothetical protein
MLYMEVAALGSMHNTPTILNDCKWLGMNGLKCQLMSVPIMYNVCDASGLPTLLLLVAQWLCNCESNTHPKFGLF